MSEENITFRSLHRKISSLQDNIEDLQKQNTKIHENISNNAKNLISEAVNNHDIKVKNIVNELKAEGEGLKQLLLADNLKLRQQIESQDKEHTSRDTLIYNTINAMDRKYSKMHFDIITNKDNIAITYVNSDGKIEYGAIERIAADETTITKDKNVLKLKNTFDSKDFKINNNIISAQGLSLSNGNKLSADKINNDLSNASYNISSINYKIENILKKLENINGYVASNNFGKNTPTQEQLSNFAISLLSSGKNTITINDIPVGTRIKNTNDNHIWVLNKNTMGGLTTYKWEDFGSDSICLANNEGVHGLVTGSDERLKGYIDINGMISINGLEEELKNILESIMKVSAKLDEIELKQLTFEKRIQVLEEK